MTSSDRCSLYLHRFGAFEMSLSNTPWKWCVQVIHPNAIIVWFRFFFFSILCQCNVYRTWCSIKCVNRVACNFVCFTFWMRTRSGFKYIRPLLCNWNPGNEIRFRGWLHFTLIASAGCNTYRADKDASKPLWHINGIYLDCK